MKNYEKKKMTSGKNFQQNEKLAKCSREKFFVMKFFRKKPE